MNSGLCRVEMPSLRKFRLISYTRSSAADDEPLQVQLGRDAQKQIDIERVVMRAERPRHRAAGNRLHHRRLDLEVSARVEKLAAAPTSALLRTWNTSRASGLTMRSR